MGTPSLEPPPILHNKRDSYKNRSENQHGYARNPVCETTPQYTGSDNVSRWRKNYSLWICLVKKTGEKINSIENIYSRQKYECKTPVLLEDLE
ncbi:MAG: hypothetical protein NWE83_00980 [Candidatus Bathyarchaeota archaeon]|nr:hypothetical protein [Candidatus Bathyarchaeota archaeon]